MRQYRGLVASERSAIYSALIFQTAGVVAGVSECPGTVRANAADASPRFRPSDQANLRCLDASRINRLSQEK